MDESKRELEQRGIEEDGSPFLKKKLWKSIQEFVLEAKEKWLLAYSGRGTGKTYNVQKALMGYCMDNDAEFAFVVKTKQKKDQGVLKNWLAKVIREQYPRVYFKWTSEICMYRKKTSDDWTILCRCLTISGADEDKLESFPRMKYIVIDEAITSDITMVDKVLNGAFTIYETADREQDEVKIIFMCNIHNKTNEIFKFFGLRVSDFTKEKWGQVVKTYNKKAWFVPVPPDMEDEDNHFRTMIKGTAYGRMSAGDVRYDTGTLIKYPPEDCPCWDCMGIQFGDSTWANFFYLDDENIYCESVTKKEWEDCNLDGEPSIKFHTEYKYASEDNPIVPRELIQLIMEWLNKGYLKFMNEESLLLIGAKMQMYLGITVGIA